MQLEPGTVKDVTTRLERTLYAGGRRKIVTDRSGTGKSRMAAVLEAVQLISKPPHGRG